MINLPYSLVIKATDDPMFFGFFSQELEGFAGVGHSVEDCLYKAKWGIGDHVELLKQNNLPFPEPNRSPTVLVRNAEPAMATA